MVGIYKYIFFHFKVFMIQSGSNESRPLRIITMGNKKQMFNFPGMSFYSSFGRARSESIHSRIFFIF